MELWLDHMCLFAGLVHIVDEPREPDAADCVVAPAPVPVPVRS